MKYKRKFRSRRRKRTTLRSVVKKVMSKELEVKYHDTNPNTFSFNESGSLHDLLDGNFQGVSDFQTRIGDKINVKYMRVGFTVDLDDASPRPGESVRVIIFQFGDDSNIAAPTTDTVIMPNASGSNVTAPYNWDNMHSGRIRVIVDKHIHLSNPLVPFRTVVISKRFKKSKIVRFSGGTSEGTHKYYILFISDNVGSTTLPSIANMYTRVTYTDA